MGCLLALGLVRPVGQCTMARAVGRATGGATALVVVAA